MKRQMAWVVMHSILMLTVVVALVSGLRIATLQSPELLRYSALLPQGDVHTLHFSAASALLAVVIGYLCYLLKFKQQPNTDKARSKSSWYHQGVVYFGYTVLLGLLVSGICVYFNWFAATQVHFYLAMALLAYIPLHALVYFIQYGLRAIKLICLPEFSKRQTNLVIVALMLVTMAGGFIYLRTYSHHTLVVKAIELTEPVNIDGIADEVLWQQANEIVVDSFGGANFVDGRTKIRVKVLENGVEAYFHVVWDDPDKSLKHLPLLKTPKGWQVQQAGFHQFDETRWYEDKFAVILSDNCDFAAAGTAHLGPKPLSDKPANHSGKGYHYSKTNAVVDLWQWKAVRTNAMVLADDNFIGPPDVVRPGSRRYTAGYTPDGKEAGAYVMNWKWYKKDHVIPKRLPKVPESLQSYQQPSIDLDKLEQPWVIPWFGYKPYQAKDDDYPVGTIMPSVMYRSNRFEGDRADVRAFAQWQDGQWSLELSRRLKTGSKHDVPLNDGVCLWLAAFDHAQIQHTRHNRPVKLRFSR